LEKKKTCFVIEDYDKMNQFEEKNKVLKERD
jgi:hypothetical protein